MFGELYRQPVIRKKKQRSLTTMSSSRLSVINATNLAPQPLIPNQNQNGYSSELIAANNQELKNQIAIKTAAPKKRKRSRKEEKKTTNNNSETSIDEEGYQTRKRCKLNQTPKPKSKNDMIAELNCLNDEFFIDETDYEARLYQQHPGANTMVYNIFEHPLSWVLNKNGVDDEILQKFEGKLQMPCLLPDNMTPEQKEAYHTDAYMDRVNMDEPSSSYYTAATSSAPEIITKLQLDKSMINASVETEIQHSLNYSFTLRTTSEMQTMISNEKKESLKKAKQALKSERITKQQQDQEALSCCKIFAFLPTNPSFYKDFECDICTTNYNDDLLVSNTTTSTSGSAFSCKMIPLALIVCDCVKESKYYYVDTTTGKKQPYQMRGRVTCLKCAWNHLIEKIQHPQEYEIVQSCSDRHRTVCGDENGIIDPVTHNKSSCKFNLEYERAHFTSDYVHEQIDIANGDHMENYSTSEALFTDAHIHFNQYNRKTKVSNLLMRNQTKKDRSALFSDLKCPFCRNDFVIDTRASYAESIGEDDVILSDKQLNLYKSQYIPGIIDFELGFTRIAKLWKSCAPYFASMQCVANLKILNRSKLERLDVSLSSAIGNNIKRVCFDLVNNDPAICNATRRIHGYKNRQAFSFKLWELRQIYYQSALFKFCSPDLELITKPIYEKLSDGSSSNYLNSSQGKTIQNLKRTKTVRELLLPISKGEFIASERELMFSPSNLHKITSQYHAIHRISVLSHHEKLIKERRLFISTHRMVLENCAEHAQANLILEKEAMDLVRNKVSKLKDQYELVTSTLESSQIKMYEHKRKLPISTYNDEEERIMKRHCLNNPKNWSNLNCVKAMGTSNPTMPCSEIHSDHNFLNRLAEKIETEKMLSKYEFPNSMMKKDLYLEMLNNPKKVMLDKSLCDMISENHKHHCYTKAY